MHYEKRDCLTTVELNGGEEKLSFSRLKEIILKRPSNIIYCEQKGKLYGIISMGDIARAADAGKEFVLINMHFIRILFEEYMRARKIFCEKAGIHALPVVSADNELLGAYIRWDDAVVDHYLRKRKWGGVECGCSKIALVQPEAMFGKEEKIGKYRLYLETAGADVNVIRVTEIPDYIEQMDWIVFMKEEEKRAADTLLTYILKKKYARGKLIVWTKYLAAENMRAYLTRLQNAGVSVYNLHFTDSKKLSILKKDIRAKYARLGLKMSNKLYPEMYEAFFDDLYSEEYAQAVAKLQFKVENKSGCGKLKDACTQFYHVVNGERYTEGCPLQYERTIYFVGPCFIYGHHVEDGNTIESFLQKDINRDFYDVRVANCGSPSYTSRSVDLKRARISDIFLKRGDIVVMADNRWFQGISNINLMDLPESWDVDSEWVIDSPAHCNHRMNELYAKIIYNKLKPALSETAKGQKELAVNNSDYIKDIYIDRYFMDFDVLKYHKIGAIVMNCNPFTKGHLYLIEQALSKVDFLIIFVVEEDKSLFSFEERFAMVCEGTAHLDNVLVAPSGPFILAQTTFPEYFIKTMDEDLTQNTENDITLFAEKIAPYLGIKYRFVGEEPEDEVTNKYNLAMKKILPGKDIEVIEIPRKSQDGKYISASSVRECLENRDWDRFRRLVPESTVKILLGDMY